MLNMLNLAKLKKVYTPELQAGNSLFQGLDSLVEFVEVTKSNTKLVMGLCDTARVGSMELLNKRAFIFLLKIIEQLIKYNVIIKYKVIVVPDESELNKVKIKSL